MSWVACACFVPRGEYKLPPTYAPCSYCSRLPDRDQLESNCRGCGGPLRSMKETTTAKQDTRHATEREIQRKRREEDDASRKRENDRLAQQSMNIAMGDITGSGIPGGFDLDITTPL